MRRALLRALLGSPLMAGDQLRRPLNAPPSGQGTPIGVQPGITNPGFFQRVIVFGPGGQPVGVFVYGGTPAIGNLPIAWVSASSTDPYGNALPSGTGIVIGTQAAGTVIGLGQGELIGYAAGELAGGLQFPGSRSLRLVSPVQNVSDTPAQLTLYSASTFGTTRTAIGTQTTFIGTGFGGIVYLSPSGDSTGATDPGLINGLLGQGTHLVLLPGQYYLNAPVNIPPYAVLEGYGAPLTLDFLVSGTPGVNNAARLIAVSSWAPSSSTGMVQFLSQTPGGWSVPAAGQCLRNVILDGSGSASTNLQGIQLTGPVYDTHISDVFIWSPPHNGISLATHAEAGIGPTAPYHQRWERLCCQQAGNTAFPISNMTDSEIDVFAFQAVHDGIDISNCSNSRFRLRSEFNGGRGVQVTGTSGGMRLEVMTDQNADEGIYVNGATGQPGVSGGALVISGKLHSDGNAGGVNSFGVHVSGATVPVDLSSLVIEVGETAGVGYPVTALSITTSSNVRTAGILQGGTTSWNWDSAGTIARVGCLGATGLPGAQVWTRLADI